MLAPKKKLWSTPIEVIEKSIEILGIKSDDIVYDIGAGDGRFVFNCRKLTNAKCVIGIEIDEIRGEEARKMLQNNGFHDENLCKIVIGNALELDYSSGTAFFMYLIPRGLRIFIPILLSMPRNKIVKIVTYMSPLPDLQPKEIIKVTTNCHQDAQWPIYFYELEPNVDI